MHEDPTSEFPAARVVGGGRSWWLAIANGCAARWRLHGKRFASAWLATVAIGVGLAAVVGIDRVVPGAFGALFAALALPVVIAVPVFLVCLVPLLPCIAFVAIFDIDYSFGEPLLDLIVDHIVLPYYRWLARQRGPVTYGLAAGVVTTVAALVTVAYVQAGPARAAARTEEARAQEAAALVGANRQQVAAVQVELAATFASTRALPASLPAARDAYGRPLAYQMRTTSLSLSYTLTSPGADPASPTDDVCVDDAFDVGPQHARGKSRLARTLWLATDLARAHFDPPLRCP